MPKLKSTLVKEEKKVVRITANPSVLKEFRNSCDVYKIAMNSILGAAVRQYGNNSISINVHDIYTDGRKDFTSAFVNEEVNVKFRQACAEVGIKASKLMESFMDDFNNNKYIVILKNGEIVIDNNK